MGRILGHIATGEKLTGCTVRIIPRDPGAVFRPGMTLEFASVVWRAGYATIAEVHGPDLVSFQHTLNSAVPAVATGDIVSEWIAPCTRCNCVRCSSERQGPSK